MVRHAVLVVALAALGCAAAPPPPPPPPPPPVAEPEPGPAPPTDAPQVPTTIAPPTPVEWTARRKRPESGILSTVPYQVLDAEEPWLAKVPMAERTTGTIFEDYSIAGKAGTAVGWFGIVHGVREDAASGTTRLLVEQKYFDGMQDSHILCTSFHGSGDFVAVLRGTGHGIPLLSMVKVYGTVAAEKDGLPRLPADFVRVFPWGTFTFMGDYGKAKGNDAWRARCTVSGDSLYSPSPGESYYRARLGDPGEGEGKGAEVPE